MLALLATTPAQRRARTWICDKLWSDRDPERAAGSLRQALAEVRRSLGRSVGVLGADRKMIWLQPGTVQVDRSGPGEFLEGMDVRDPEWEDWLRARRAEDDDPEATRPAPVPAQVGAPRQAEGLRADVPAVALTVPRGVDPGARFLAGVVGEQLARNLAESTGIRANLDDEAKAPLSLTVTPHVGREGPSVSLSLRRRPDGTQLWSGTRTIMAAGTPRGDDLVLNALLADAQDAIAASFAGVTSPASGPAGLVVETQRAARRIMAYDIRKMPEIEARLEEICDAEPNATVLGWLLLLKRIMFYERAAIATLDWIAHLTFRCEQAVAIGNTNAFALAAVSGAYLRLAGRPAEAVELARRAVRLNPSNPFALDALASAMYMTGRIDDGCRLSSAARMMTANTSYAHFFEMSLSMASLLAGKKDQASKLSNAALALAPDFRAALRARIVLSATRGNLDDAAEASARLQRIEPGFTLDRMVRDPDYPVGILRQTCAQGFDRLDELA